MGEERRGLDFGLEGSVMSLKQVGVILGVVFAITLAVVVGKQMSAEAMAVVVGVVCGVAAGLPASILVLVVLTRRERPREEGLGQQGRQDGYPPVVVIQGGTPQALPPGQQAGYWPTSMPGPANQRRFNVVGDDDLLLDDGE